MPDKILNIITPDDHRFDINCYGESNADKVLLFFPAMGVEARYYKDWARNLSESGFLCCIPDLRGHGSSSIRAGSGTDYGYHNIIEQDYQAAIKAVQEYTGTESIYLGGHSLGGQLSCLYAATRSDQQQWLSGLLLIASGTVYHKGWSGVTGLAMRLVPRFFSAISRAVGYFPGHIVGFAGREARQQMLDWSHSSIHGKYKPLGYETWLEPQMSRVKVPLVAVSFDKDLFTTKASVEHLTSKMSGCKVSHSHLTEADVPADILNHFQWARRSIELTTGLVTKGFS